MKITSAAVAALATLGLLAPAAHASYDDTLFVPGTGSTTPNAPDRIAIGWLDHGRWGDEAACICDSNVYPAKLGPGEGQPSADAGDEAAVEYLLAHPGIRNLIGGSQGGGVAYEAAYDPRLAGRPLNVVTYSSMDAPLGLRARAAGVQDIPFVGLRGGVPAVPNDPSKSVTDIGQDWDPIFKSPKYQLSWPVTIPTGIVGFVDEHGDIGDIDYTGATVEQVGPNHTVITLHGLTPWGKLATIVATNVAGPQAGFVTQTLIRPADDVVAGVLKGVGGYDEPGAASLAPMSAGEVQRAAQRVVGGFTQAAQDFVAVPQTLAAGPKPKATTPPTTAAVQPATTTAAKTTTKTATTAPVKTATQPKVTAKPKPFGGPGNPVHDTIKTVQGLLKNLAPKAAAPNKSAGEAK